MQDPGSMGSLAKSEVLDPRSPGSLSNIRSAGSRIPWSWGAGSKIPWIPRQNLSCWIPDLGSSGSMILLGSWHKSAYTPHYCFNNYLNVNLNERNELKTRVNSAYYLPRICCLRLASVHPAETAEPPSPPLAPSRARRGADWLLQADIKNTMNKNNYGSRMLSATVWAACRRQFGKLIYAERTIKYLYSYLPTFMVTY